MDVPFAGITRSTTELRGHAWPPLVMRINQGGMIGWSFGSVGATSKLVRSSGSHGDQVSRSGIMR